MGMRTWTKRFEKARWRRLPIERAPAEDSLRYPDTLVALQNIAAWARDQWGGRCGGRNRQRRQNVHEGCDRRHAGRQDAGSEKR